MNDVANIKAEHAADTPAQLPAIPDDKHAKIAERKPRKRDTESIINIVTAIANITGECGVVDKRGHNKFHNYKFAQMGDILQQLTPLIAKHGLIIVQSEVARNMLDDGRMVAVEYEFTMAHTSGEVWPDRPRQTGLCRCRDSKGGFDDKSFAKAHTAARKYFLLALFQIATGDEDDSDLDERAPPPVKASPIKKPVPAHDPVTGEIFESDAAAMTLPPAAEDAPATSGRSGAGALSLEDRARKKAKGGRESFRPFWRNLSTKEQDQLGPIGTELGELMKQADAAKETR